MTTPKFIIRPLDQEPLEESLSMLYYGGSGVGKTYFCATAGPRTFIVNIGKGLITIKSKLVAEKFYKNGMPLVATIVEETNLADAFDQVCDSIDDALEHFSDKFDTIIVDDASELKTMAMSKGIEISGQPDINRSKTGEKIKKYGHAPPGVQDFGMEMDLIDKFVAGTIDLCKRHKKHFILTAHERLTFKKLKDQSGKVIGEEVEKTRPGFTGKTFPDDVPRHFDMVWRADVVQLGKGPLYRAYTNPSGTIAAKTRFPGVFELIEKDPNWLNIVERINKSLK